MMQSEFEDITGVPVTAQEYSEIEKKYIDAPEGWTKFTFCAEWLVGEGIKDLLRSRASRITELDEKIKELEAEVKEANDDADEALGEAEDWEARYYEEKDKLDSLICGLHKLIA